jgi:hypothetical protein
VNVPFYGDGVGLVRQSEDLHAYSVQIVVTIITPLMKRAPYRFPPEMQNPCGELPRTLR